MPFVADEEEVQTQGQFVPDAEPSTGQFIPDPEPIRTTPKGEGEIRATPWLTTLRHKPIVEALLGRTKDEQQYQGSAGIGVLEIPEAFLAGTTPINLPPIQKAEQAIEAAQQWGISKLPKPIQIPVGIAAAFPTAARNA